MADWDDHEKQAEFRRESKRAKMDKLARDEAVRALLAHSNGRAYLFWLFEITGALGQNPFTGHALTTSFKAGEQNIGQQVLAHMLEVDPNGFVLMLKEKADATRSRSDDNSGSREDSGTNAGDDYDAGDGTEAGSDS